MKIEFDTDPGTVRNIIANLESLVRSTKHAGMEFLSPHQTEDVIKQIRSQIKNKDDKYNSMFKTF